MQARQVTLENIQKTVADYYRVRMTDLLSKRRSRSIARPRQVAMCLAKDSLTTACRRSAMPSAAATIRRCCTRAGRIRDFRETDGKLPDRKGIGKSWCGC